MGYWLSLINLVGGLVYFSLVSIAYLDGGLPPVEPYQTMISIITFFSIPGIILLWVVIYRITPPSKKLYSLSSLVMITIFATLTSLNRYNSLAMVPQALAMGKTDGLQWFLPYGWPSLMAAVEVLAWGVYYGLACLCLAPAFRQGRLEKTIFWTLILSGGLSMLSALGQVLNNIALNLLGIIAWGPGFIFLMVLWMRWFTKLQGDLKF
jgi:hypothetical protein